MRPILFDIPNKTRSRFYPLALSRPIWELRCGITDLEEKLRARLDLGQPSYFVPGYMERDFRERSGGPVNEPSALVGDDLLLLNPKIKAEELDIESIGVEEVGIDEDNEVLYARIPKDRFADSNPTSIQELLELARKELPTAESSIPRWEFIWDLVEANGKHIEADFERLGRSGIEGRVEPPNTIRGEASTVYVAPGAQIHPMVVIDAESGPVYIDEEAVIQPFSRIEGPCYIGKKTIVLGAKCREGNSIGPDCRIGGEVEESIVQGYSNKYHDGFLGHAYVGEWVNLGALTTNSDLKNDYSSVRVPLEGGRHFDTGSTKIGCFIGDHTKTSIGTLLNTGTHIGAMCLLLTEGKLMPKYLPSFTWYLHGEPSLGFGKNRLYEAAEKAMARRGVKWTDTQIHMWDIIFELTSTDRNRLLPKASTT